MTTPEVYEAGIAAVNRLAAAIEVANELRRLDIEPEATDPAPCETCGGRGRTSPGVWCATCSGAGVAA